MVIAGPGTGKTTILTLRIANILRKTDTPPSGVLAITYTEAGVQAMRAKLREVIGSRADEVRIHTFHGLAASVIAEFDDHFPHLARSKQMAETEAEELMRGILVGKAFAALRPLGDPDFYVKKALSAISEAKREAWTPEMLRQHAERETERVKSDESSISTRGATKGQLKADALKRIEKCERTVLLADAYAAYEEKKRAERMMDFDDLIFELGRALREDELLLRQLQERFLYILVDEHQDTNDAQNAIVRLIADFFEEPNLFVVGDEKQAIYRFQGASVENFLRFKDVWKSMKVIPLEDNYRSHQAILDATFSLIEHNYEEGALQDLRVRLRAGGREEAKPIDVVTAGNVEAAEKALVERLRSLKEGRTAAVIVRTNRDAGRVAALLDAEGIAASSERYADIFSHPVGLLFFELARYLSDPGQTEALAYTVAGGLWGLSFDARASLTRSLRAGDASAAAQAIPALAELEREASKSGAVSFVMHAAETSGLVAVAARDPLSIEVWRGIVALAQELALRGSVDDPRQLISALLSHKASSEGRGVKIGAGSADAPVRVMTAHSSKGLEFDEVFAMYATEESWMGRGRPAYFVLPREREEGDDIRDARRLFYVALTRARAHATVIVPLEEEGGRILSPLRFIAELDQSKLSRESVPAARERSLAPKPGRGEEASRRERAEYAKRALLDGGLSVTALNHFVKCPSLFFYKSVLKVPEAPSPSSEKGVAMHQAVSRVWSSEKRDKKSIQEAIEAEARAYLAGSTLAKGEKERVIDEILKDAPAVATELERHFAVSGDASTERWFESERELSAAGGEAVRIRLHGRLDAVVETADAAYVYDYKTREGMSDAEIRGETKATEDGKGAYFRQLVFYSMLLGANPAYKGKRVVPSLVFLRPDKKGRLAVANLPIERADVERVEAEIQGLVDAVWSGKLLDGRCGDADCPWCALTSL